MDDSKQVISDILSQEQRDWKDVRSELPANEVPVVIRIFKPGTTMRETEDNIIPWEDVVLGKCVYDHQDKTKYEWIVCTPHHRFEYGPLYKQGHLLEGVEVSHWALPEEDEIEGWKRRLNPNEEYEEFKITIQMKDKEREAQVIENMYRILILAQQHIFVNRKYVDPNDPIRDGINELYSTVEDAIAAMDFDGLSNLKDLDDEEIDRLAAQYEGADDPPYVEFPVSYAERKDDQ